MVTEGGLFSITEQSIVQIDTSLAHQDHSTITLKDTAVRVSNNSMLTTEGNGFRLHEGDGSGPSSLTVNEGGLLSVTNESMVTIGRELIKLEDGSSITFISTDAAVIVDKSILTVDMDFIDMTNSTLTAPGGLLFVINTSTAVIGDGPEGSGGILKMVGNSLSANSTLVRVAESTLKVKGTAEVEGKPEIKRASFSIEDARGFFDDGENFVPGGVEVINGGILSLEDGSQFGNEVDVDTGLLKATLPLLAMLRSDMTTGDGFVKVIGRSTFTANVPNDALVLLDASTLTIQNGSLVNVGNVGAGVSSVSITGTFVSLANGSTLNIFNGGLATVGVGGTFTLDGAIASFSGGGNTLNFTNNLCPPGACTSHPDSSLIQIFGPVNFVKQPNYNPLPGFSPGEGGDAITNSTSATFINNGGTLTLPRQEPPAVF